MQQKRSTLQLCPESLFWTIEELELFTKKGKACVNFGHGKCRSSDRPGQKREVRLGELID